MRECRCHLKLPALSSNFMLDASHRLKHLVYPGHCSIQHSHHLVCFLSQGNDVEVKMLRQVGIAISVNWVSESERNWVYFFESEDQLFNLFKCAEPHLGCFLLEPSCLFKDALHRRQ